MQQIFPRSANAIAKASIVVLVVLAVAIAVAAYVLVRSPIWTGQNVTVDQPVMFSHQHHVGGLGIQCQYCHNSVTQASYAGMPPTHTCMSCHSQLYTDQAALAPVRQSYASGTPIQWNRVTKIGDFVYFNHSIHVQNGVGCATCHGRIDQMQLVAKAQPMTMQWCLNCHNAPEQFLRPREDVFDMAYVPPARSVGVGAAVGARISHRQNAAGELFYLP